MDAIESGRLDGFGARRPPPRLRSTRRSAVESGSTDSCSATSSTIFTSSSESRRRASASWPPCVQQAEARKEAARFILAYCLASMRAASGGKEGSGGERAIERRQGKKRCGVVRRWRPSSASVRSRTRACERASKGKWRGPRRDLLP